MPYAGSSRSAPKVPNSRSQTISVPPWLRSMYCGLRAWCTRWCDGVLRTHSSGPSRPTSRVWIQNW